jgi:indolepyruvate ferredoxin oxidoreductase
MTDVTSRPTPVPTPVPVALRTGYALTDRITRDHGTVFASGVQAVARILVEQLRVDRTNGQRTAAFASGYPGSPLAGLDGELAKAAKLVEGDLPLVFQPGLNEELAAAAVMGSQFAQSHGGAKYDGVIGLWFAKAPGIDRACDAIRHGVFGGTHPLGGVLCVVGDDPAAKSSTLPSSSDATLVDLHIPILYPVDVQDALDLGRHGIALSRASGLWAGLKMVANVADGTATIDLDPNRVQPAMPEWLVDGVPFVPKPSNQFLPPYNLELEREILDVRTEVARAYGRLNNLNRVEVDPGSSARIGIAACGYTAGETREALARLGLRTDADIAAAGIRLLVLRMPYPLDASTVRDFARGLTEVIVIEEKNPTLEWLCKDALWGGPDHPVIVGKQDTEGAPLFQRAGHLDADAIVGPLRRRLAAHLGEDRLAPLPKAPRPRIALSEARTPWFCSGCPHHWGTKLPEGSLYGAGIGCHTMTALQPEGRIGELASLGAMGGEGAPWIGMAPFMERNHFIQNLGDGTFFHSGQLAIQAAIAAGVNITYKLLYNGAVAMTGGQDAPGRVGVPEVASLLLTHGVKRVLVTTDDLDRYRRIKLPRHVEVWDRTRIVEAQELLRDVKGVTVLIHDQACAAELRRDRKRGLVAPPSFRVVINERVCEGCGHCGETSGCLSVQPTETEFGRKTTIEQTSCNLDASCLEGDCPSFMTVAIDPAKPFIRTQTISAPTIFPAPTCLVPDDDCTIRLAGIGGTGVVTVSQILGTAALLEGRSAKGLDQTGLSQKAGPVVSDIRITRPSTTAGDHGSNKAGVATAHVMLAMDLLVGAHDSNLRCLVPGESHVVGSSSATPTGPMVIDPRHAGAGEATLTDRLAEVSGHRVVLLDASAITTAFLGDASTANIVVVGAALQAGCLPLGASAVEEAITLNGVAVSKNLEAFRWGRAWVADQSAVEAALAQTAPSKAAAPVSLPAILDCRIAKFARGDELGRLLRSRTAELIAFQDERCAAAYLDMIEEVARAEAQLVATNELTIAVARNLFQLTAYKDEYEVARLLVAPEAKAAAEAVGGPGAAVTWKLHPPMLRALGMDSKISLGPKTRPVLVALAQGKRLRGTKLDPFGRAHVRRLERALLSEYRTTVTRLIGSVRADNLTEAIRIASLPDIIRGYEDRKVKRASEYRAALAEALSRWP